MKFKTDAIVSCYTGVLVCDIDHLVRLQQFLVNYPLKTNNHAAMVKACQICAPWLEYSFRWLKEIKVADCTPNNWETWIANINQQYGSEHNVKRIPGEWWEKLATKMNLEIANELRRLRIASKLN